MQDKTTDNVIPMTPEAAVGLEAVRSGGHHDGFPMHRVRALLCSRVNVMVQAGPGDSDGSFAVGFGDQPFCGWTEFRLTQDSPAR